MSDLKLMIYATITVVLLGLTFIAIDAFGYERNHNCEKNPIYCQIIANRPTIKRAYAFKLSNIIHNKARRYKLDPNIFTAILAQESMYKVSAKNCTTGLIPLPWTVGNLGANETTIYEYVVRKVCTDFGIGQIWYKTADSYEFDYDKLITDMDYSVEASAIVLEHFKNRYSKKEATWWTRYNASSKDARAKYKDLVDRFINTD